MAFFSLKRTENCSIMQPISDHITKGFGSHQLDSVRQLLQQVQDLRNYIASAGRAVSQNLITAYRRYLYFLHIIARHFTFGSTRDTVMAKFKWSDTVHRKDKMLSGSMQFEISCVIYNIAMMKAMTAYSIIPKSQDQFKQALKDIQEIVSLIAFVKDNLRPKFATESEDLSSEWLFLLYHLNMSKAAEIVYNTALGKGKVNPSLLSKLAKQAATHFESAYECSRHSNNDIVLKFNKIARINQLAFLAACQYQKVQSELEEVRVVLRGFGRLVGRLRLAKSYLIEGRSVLEGSSESVQNAVDLKNLETNVEVLLRELDEDNRKVYMEIVPNAHTLHDIDDVHTINIKELIIEEIYIETPGVSGSFNSLIPASMRETLASNNEHLSRKVQELDGIIAMLTRSTTQTMPDLSENINTIWNAIYKSQQMFGVDVDEKALATKFKHIQNEFEMCQNSLDATLDILWDSLRLQSTPKKRELLEATQNFIKYLQAVEDANKTAENGYELFKEDLKIINGSKEDLTNHLQEIYTHTHSPKSPHTSPKSSHTHSPKSSQSDHDEATALKEEFEELRSRIRATNLQQMYHEIKNTVETPQSMFNYVLRQFQSEMDELRQKLQNLKNQTQNGHTHTTSMKEIEEYQKNILGNIELFKVVNDKIDYCMRFFGNMNDKIEELSRDVQRSLGSI